MSKPYDDKILAVQCPYCRVSRGIQCIKASSYDHLGLWPAKIRKYPHPQRVEASNHETK